MESPGTFFAGQPGLRRWTGAPAPGRVWLTISTRGRRSRAHRCGWGRRMSKRLVAGVGQPAWTAPLVASGFMSEMEYRYVLVNLNKEDANGVLDEWSKAGWELYSSSLALLGLGYGAEAHTQLIWQRPR